MFRCGVYKISLSCSCSSIFFLMCVHTLYYYTLCFLYRLLFSSESGRLDWLVDWRFLVCGSGEFISVPQSRLVFLGWDLDLRIKAFWEQTNSIVFGGAL